MLIWIVSGVLTAVAVAALVRPLMRDRSDDRSFDATEADLAVYTDQLAEIESDKARGLIEAAEAEAAKAELGRRILQSVDDGSNELPKKTKALHKKPKNSRAENSRQTSGATWFGPRGLAYMLALFVPVASIAGYTTLGAPNLPAQPFAQRLTKPPGQTTVAELVAKVQARLRTNPEDGQGWDVLAPIYFKERRFEQAAEAFSNALLLLGETPERLQGLAEARIMASNGQVGPVARQAFAKILKQKPEHVEARFWLATAKEQDGDLSGAITAYEELLKFSDNKVPWRKVVEHRLAATQKKAGIEPTVRVEANSKTAETNGSTRSNGSSGSSAPDAKSADVKSAFPDGVPPQIVAMVEGLATKLKADGKNIDGWLQLIKSYRVLGRTGDAKAASVEAKKHFPDGTAEAKKIDELLAELKLKD